MDYKVGDVVIASFWSGNTPLQIQGTITSLYDTWCVLDGSWVIQISSINKIIKN